MSKVRGGKNTTRSRWRQVAKSPLFALLLLGPSAAAIAWSVEAPAGDPSPLGRPALEPRAEPLSAPRSTPDSWPSPRRAVSAAEAAWSARRADEGARLADLIERIDCEGEPWAKVDLLESLPPGSAPEFVEDLLRRYRWSPDAEVRAAALRSMRASSASHFLREFEDALGDPDPIVRREAILAVGEFEAAHRMSEETREKLTGLLRFADRGEATLAHAVLVRPRRPGELK